MDWENQRASENLLHYLGYYSGKEGCNLNELRFTSFCSKAATNKKYTPPERLPPSSSAAKYHSLRIYLQVQDWKGNKLPAEDWGWQHKTAQLVGQLKPIQMDMGPAPEIF